MESFGSTEGPRGGCNVFFTSHISHLSINMKFVGKLVVSRVEVSPSEEDNRVEDVSKGVTVWGPCIQSKLGEERTEEE